MRVKGRREGETAESRADEGRDEEGRGQSR